jgi:hypothetical protein
MGVYRKENMLEEAYFLFLLSSYMAPTQPPPAVIVQGNWCLQHIEKKDEEWGMVCDPGVGGGGRVEHKTMTATKPGASSIFHLWLASYAVIFFFFFFWFESKRRKEKRYCPVCHHHRGGRGLSLFLSSEWDSPNPSPAGECAPPFRSGGGGHTRRRERGWESPDSGEGTYTVVLCIYIYFVFITMPGPSCRWETAGEQSTRTFFVAQTFCWGKYARSATADSIACKDDL